MHMVSVCCSAATLAIIDPKEKIIGIFMTQSALLESRGQVRDDFETAVMQAIVGGSGAQTATN